MRQTTAVLLTVVLATACSAGSPVGFFDSTRITTESAAAHAALDAPNQAVRQAQASDATAQEAIAHADEVTVAAKRADADKAADALKGAQAARFTAGKALDDRINAIVGKLAVARRMTVVIGLDGKPNYAAPGTDLTADLIVELDGGASELARAKGAAVAAMKKVRELETKEATAPPAIPPTVQAQQKKETRK